MNLKKSLALLGLAFNILNDPLLAQNDTLFVTELGEFVPKEKAQFYRIAAPIKNDLTQIIEYYLTDTIRSIGTYNNTQGTLKNGHFINFSPKGIKTNEGEYVNGFKQGEWLYYGEDGKIITKREIYHYPQKGHYDAHYDQKTGDLLREGQIDPNDKRTGLWKEFHYHSNKVRFMNHYVSGIKQGEQLEYYNNSQLKRREFFEGFQIVESAQYDVQGQKVKYFPAFKFPEPTEPLKKYLSVRVKCFDAMLKSKNIEYQLRVNIDGSISDVEILNMSDTDCKLEMIAALMKMKKWKPAKRENTPTPYLVESVIRYHSYNE